MIIKYESRQFTIDFHLGLWLACGFKNGQWGLNIEPKFFKHKSSAVRYGKLQLERL